MTTISWLPIKYRDFYDVPRVFVAENGGCHYLFDCVFDSKADDYSRDYAVYRLPTNTGGRIDEIRDWRSLYAEGARIGSVGVARVIFDKTKRQFVDAGVLKQFK